MGEYEEALLTCKGLLKFGAFSSVLKNFASAHYQLGGYKKAEKIFSVILKKYKLHSLKSK